VHEGSAGFPALPSIAGPSKGPIAAARRSNSQGAILSVPRMRGSGAGRRETRCPLRHLGEGTHVNYMERTRMKLFEAVQSFLDEASPSMN
jgi:hypothetical protein